MTPGNIPTFPVRGSRFAVRVVRALQRRTANRERGTVNPPRRRGAGRGFTLIELMIVVTIIGILATISQPMFRSAVLQAREAALRENLYVLRDALDKYYADNDKYPENLADLADRKYIRRIPKDPITGSAQTWQVEQTTDEKTSQPTGIIDVKSGSEATGSDGQKYSDW